MTPEKIIPDCGTCICYVPVKAEGVPMLNAPQDRGECRRHPPQVVAVQGKGGQLVSGAGFPQTHPGNWCAEYRVHPAKSTPDGKPS